MDQRLIIACLLLTLAAVPLKGDITCATGCSYCYGGGSNQCYECSTGIMESMSCVTECSTGYTYDSYDNICKKTRYPYENPCPKGTYNQANSKGSSSDCIDCPQGNYCPGIANTGDIISCPAGYYCSTGAYDGIYEGSDSSNPSQGCVKGYYCEESSPTPTDCPAGKYCDRDRLSAASGPCDAGHFCIGNTLYKNPTNETNEKGRFCTAGYYCPQGTSYEKPCPEGTYMNYIGAKQQSDCITCPAGKYCSGTGQTGYTGTVSAGYYSKGGAKTTEPSGNYCTPGFYCPAGSYNPLPCDYGYYQPNSKQSSCLTCPAGYYCDEDNTAKECKTGFYCTGSNAKDPCPIGTYKDTKGGTDSSSCTSCPAGYACQQVGLNAYSVKCAKGYYCSGGTTTRFPTSNGGKCTAGNYCPEGSSSMTTCTAGSYCLTDGLSEPTGKCFGGYYCEAGSETPIQHICSSGYYCPEGSSSQTACPKGTYNPMEGVVSSAGCIECDHGQACDTEGLSAPNIQCAAGYYCPLGLYDESSIVYQCPAGFKCPPGSFAPTKCTPGYYQPDKGQSTCLNCPAGKYCDLDTPKKYYECPKGYYCEINTHVPYQNPCPAGKYLDTTGKAASSDCKVCEAGFYCPNKGQSTYSDLCLAGYYCTSGHVGNAQSVCTVGHYCTEGTGTPIECSIGTYNDFTYGTDYTDCQDCPRGYYCNLEGKTLAQLQTASTPYYGPCTGGYYCTGGSTTPTPTNKKIGLICPKGYECPEGSWYPQLCQLGYYMKSKGAASCTECDAGFSCAELGLTDKTSCSSFYYCPAGSTRMTECPPGKLSSKKELTAATECEACPAGSYCEKFATDSAGTCGEGFVCAAGTRNQYPNMDSDGATSGKCTVGHYCPAGTSTPQACALGTYQNSRGATECKDCPPGKYCGSTGLGATALPDCDGGYLCKTKCETATPLDGTKGDQCSATKKCPAGTAMEMNCEDGYYQTGKGNAACTPCLAGKICNFHLTTGQYDDCPAHGYCTGGRSYYGSLCDPGTMTETTEAGLAAASECSPCEKSKYCVDGRKAELDSCAAGFYCDEGAYSPIQDTTNDDTDKSCPKGYYCGAATTYPTVCPDGKFRGEKGGMKIDDCTDCLPGQYCITGEPVPEVCPNGQYCPLGATEPFDCPTRTYADAIIEWTNGEDSTALDETHNSKGLGYKFQCESCPAGYFCDEEGIGDLTEYACPGNSFCYERAELAISCPAGTYNNGGADDSDSCVNCPEGYYCEQGATEPVLCASGESCDAGSMLPTTCQAGYYCKVESGVYTKALCSFGTYCPSGTSEPIDCPDEYICPDGSAFPSACPYGTFMQEDITSASTLDEVCETCEPGYYSGVEKCEVCTAGYICLGETINKYPLDRDENNGYECPAGYYCPTGALVELACPVGTYRNEKRGASLSDCYSCPENTYNPYEAQTKCFKCGASARSEPGSTSCECEGAYRFFQPTDGNCRCMAGYYFENDGVESKTDDASNDCIPKVYKTCSDSETLNYEGECVKTDSCSSQCPEGGSYYNGICTCNDALTVDEGCDIDCRSTALIMTLKSPTVVEIMDPTNEENVYSFSFSSISTMFVPDVAFNPTYQMKTVSVGSSGFSGKYGVPESLETAFTNKYPERRLFDRRRRLEAASNPEVTTPIVCITAGESVVFGVSIATEDEDAHYPVYLKDSLLNTVEDFDYGAFMLLADRMTKTSLNTDQFVFTFEIEGNYLFGDAADPNKQMLIHVQTETCTEAYILPMKSTSLESMKVYPREDILTKAEYWIFLTFWIIIVLIFLLCGFLLLKLLPGLLEFMKAGKETYKVMDKSKFAELDEDEQYREMQNMLKKGQEGIDSIFFTFLNEKLKEADEKMKEIFDKANMSTIKKLRKLVQKIKDLNDTFNEHFGALITNEGLTIEEYLNMYDDNINTADSISSYFTSKSATPKSASSHPPSPRTKKLMTLKEEGIGLRKLQGIVDESKKEKDSLIEELEESKSGESSPKSSEQKWRKMDREAKEIQEIKANQKKEKEQIRDEIDKKKNDYRKMLEKEGLSEAEIEQMMRTYEDKLKNLQLSLEEECKKQNEDLMNKLKARRQKKEQGEQILTQLEEHKKAEQNKFRSELSVIKQNRKKDLQEVNAKIEKMKEEGLDLIKEHEMKTLDDLRKDFLKKIEKEKDPKEVEKLIKKHEEDNRRLKSYLDLEKKRQEEELMRKLQKRKDNKKIEIIQKYSNEEELLKAKHANEEERIKKEELMVQIDHNINKEEEVPDIDELNNRVTEKLKLDQEMEKKVKDFERAKEIELDLIKNKFSDEFDAVRKEFELNEQELKRKLDQKLIEFDARTESDFKALKKRFQKELSNAPTSKEKKEVVAQYEEAKIALQEALANEKNHQEEILQRKLLERKKRKENKEIQLNNQLQNTILTKEMEFEGQKSKEQGNHSLEAIEKIVREEMERGTLDVTELPVFIDDLLREKSDFQLRELAKKQFTEQTKALTNLYGQIMKEKISEKKQLKEEFEQKYILLDKQEIPAQRYRREFDLLKDKEAEAFEQLDVKFDNMEIDKENKLRTDLAERHSEEKLKQAEREEEDRVYIMDKLLREFIPQDKKLRNDIMNQLNLKNKDALKERIDDIKLSKKRQLEDLKKRLFEENEEGLQALKERAEEELKKEEKNIEDKLENDKKRVLEERKRLFDERMEKLKDVSDDQKDVLLAQYNKELDKLSAKMAEERENQLRKMKDKLLEKKIEQERLKARAAARQKRMQEVLEEHLEEIQPEEEDEIVRPPTRTEPSTRVERVEISYRPKLKEWVESVREKNPEAEIFDFATSMEDEKKEEYPRISELSKVVSERSSKFDKEKEKEEEGQFVHIRELFEKIYVCDDIATEVHEREFPELDDCIKRLQDLMDYAERNNKKFGMQFCKLAAHKYEN